MLLDKLLNHKLRLAAIISCCLQHEEQGEHLEPYFTPKHSSQPLDYVDVELGLGLSQQEIHERRMQLKEPTCGYKSIPYPQTKYLKCLGRGN